MTELDDQVVAEFRTNAGVVLDAMGGHFSNIHLLLLHHTGRRSGKLYVTPLLYVEDGGRYVLIGSNGGAEKEPAWVANVAAMPEVVIEVGEQMLTATPTIVRSRPQWDRSTRRRWPIGPTSSPIWPAPTPTRDLATTPPDTMRSPRRSPSVPFRRTAADMPPSYLIYI